MNVKNFFNLKPSTSNANITTSSSSSGSLNDLNRKKNLYGTFYSNSKEKQLGAGKTGKAIGGARATPKNSVGPRPGSVVNTADIASVGDRVKNDEKTVQEVSRLPENSICADCTSADPRWVSLSLGVWLCNACSEIHREVLGKVLSDIKSMDIGTTTFWTPETIQFLAMMGNKKANAKFEFNVTPPYSKPQAEAQREIRLPWIKAKYDSIEFLKPTKGFLWIRAFQKKKPRWANLYVTLTPNSLDIYESVDEKVPLETVELNGTVLNFEVAKSEQLPSGKEPKLNPACAFQLIAGEKTYVFNANSTEEYEDWVSSLKFLITRLRGIQHREQFQTPESVPPSPTPTLTLLPSSSSIIGSSLDTSSATSFESSSIEEEGNDSSESDVIRGRKSANAPKPKKKLDSNMLRELLKKRTEEKETEKLMLKQQLEQALKTLATAREEKTGVQAELEELEKVCSELQAEQQSIQLRLCQLEPENQLINAHQVDNSARKDDDLGGPNQINFEDGVKGGTITMLIETLTHQDFLDTDYLNAFLLTYRSFMNSADFLERLIQRFQKAPPPFIDDEDLKRFQETMQRPIRLRVFNVLKHWLTNHFYDFELDNNLVIQLIKFIDEVMEPAGMDRAGLQLRQLLRKQIKGSKSTNNVMLDTGRIPKPLHPVDIKTITFEEIEPLEVARQMCLIEQAFYRAIKPHECLNQAWNHKKLKETAAPNILAMIRRFNRVSGFVTSSIVKCSVLKDRAKKLERFIIIAQHLRELHNYNAVQEIVSALNGAAIHRLKKTWESLDPKILDTFDVLRKLMDSHANYEAFRSALHKESPPSIPYLGMYLTDLTFIEDGNPDILPDSGLINFSKRRKIAFIIREIQQYQNTPYSLQEIPAIKTLLSSGLQGLDDKQAYNLSLIVEPRDSQKK